MLNTPIFLDPASASGFTTTHWPSHDNNPHYIPQLFKLAHAMTKNIATDRDVVLDISGQGSSGASKIIDGMQTNVSTRRTSNRKSAILASHLISASSRNWVAAQRKRPRHQKKLLPSFPRLFDLPLELVDMVLAQMLRNGSAGILRTSHDVYQRAVPLLRRNGYCRMSFSILPCGSQYSMNSSISAVTPLETISSIQNAEIRISHYRGRSAPRWASVPLESEPTVHPWRVLSSYGLQSFLDRGTRRQNCHIIIETDESDPSLSDTRDLFPMLRLLINFDHVSVTYDPIPVEKGHVKRTVTY